MTVKSPRQSRPAAPIARTPATVPARCGAMWPVVCLLAALVIWPQAAAAQSSPPSPGCTRPPVLAYVGDSDFPPFEYLDGEGKAAGFNVELISAISRELGVPIEVHLLPWPEARDARARGLADLFSAGFLATRADQFDYLTPTTTVRSSLLMRNAQVPESIADMRGRRIAIQDGTPSVEAFEGLPADARPTIVPTSGHRASIALLAAGRVDAAAGSGATLQWHAAAAGLEDLAELPLNSRPYSLATRRGCGKAMADIVAVVDQFKRNGVLDEISHRTLSPRGREFGDWGALLAAAGVIVGLFAAALGWTWTLRRKVRSRTQALSETFQEQKRLTDLIRSNEGRLALAMDILGAGVWEWEIQTGRITASTRWAGSFGYPPEEVPRSVETWMAYVHPEDRDRVAKAAQAHFEGRTPRYEATYRIPRKSGEWIWVLDRGRIVDRDENGQPVRMVGALNDITVQLAAERALHEAKEAAEATSNAKSAFLATVSHEIRTPLNAVIGTANVLDHTPLDEDQRQLVELIRRGGDSLLAIVDDLLDFTKIEAGRLELDVRPFELPRLAREWVAFIEPTAREKNLAISVDIEPGVPAWVSGDESRLRQIVLNLLSNAVKFTERGGVFVRVCREGDSADGVHLRFDVRDTGIGIPHERLDRLFQPFSQVDSSTTRRFGGTGLGLAISRRLAGAMGGSIDVTTEDGVGSTFSLRIALPLAQPVAAPAVAAAAIAAAPSSIRVILAEDNAVNQLVQRRMLAQLGYRCDVVSTGVELLTAAGEVDYDVALVDIQMPEMDGLEAARRIRRRGQRVHLIALTADVTSETREACMAAGFDEYLSKPVKLDALSESLRRAVERRYSAGDMATPAAR